MARIEILKIEDLRTDEVLIKKPHSEDFNHKQKIFIRNYGQFIIRMVAKVEEVYRIVDGVGFVKNYQNLGNSEITCNIVSDNLSLRDFIMMRLFINIKRNQLNHIAIAEVISGMFKTKRDFKLLGNRINISEDDIEKYSTLLDFDWDEFARKPIASEIQQMNFFDMFDKEDNDIF